ncbi:Putative teichuronic acid biosynthesis glycosyltransferase TuaC [Myxococcaceae bacterium]|nr:Putative teichuronic acid biosynthesis glycosyltransferase TuaC [Myxococcaceae bacterium]
MRASCLVSVIRRRSLTEGNPHARPPALAIKHPPRTADPARVRLACVGHGDHRAALRRFAAGGSETYQGQRHSLDALDALAAGGPLLVVSLDAPRYEEEEGTLRMIGIGEAPRWMARPRRLAESWRSRSVIAALESFAPTHVLLRTMDVVGCGVLDWSTRRCVPSAAIIAGRFERAHPASLRFAKLANHPSVAFVGNHNRVATASMLDCGLDPAKAIAWDWPPAVVPDGKPPRTRNGSLPLRLVYAGSLLRTKGVLDLADAALALERSGIAVRLTMFGDGPEADRLSRHPAARSGALLLPGRTAHENVLDALSTCDLAVVPSHPEFPEGLPLFLYEALALRVPAVLSEHPVLLAYFRDGEGVAFAPPRDGTRLAKVIAALARDASRYELLSQATLHAWRSIQCEVRYEDLLDRLSARWRGDTCTR